MAKAKTQAKKPAKVKTKTKKVDGKTLPKRTKASEDFVFVLMETGQKCPISVFTHRPLMKELKLPPDAVVSTDSIHGRYEENKDGHRFIVGEWWSFSTHQFFRLVCMATERK